MSSSQVRVLVANRKHEPNVRSLAGELRNVLRAEVAEVNEVSRLLTEVARVEPSYLVIELSVALGLGSQGFAEVRRLAPRCQVVLATGREEPSSSSAPFLFEALSHGAYAAESARLAEFVRTLIGGAGGRRAVLRRDASGATASPWRGRLAERAVVQWSAPEAAPRPGAALARGLATDLHDETGRIDARRVAEAYGLTIPELAKAIHRNAPAIYKTPTAPTLQAPLRVLYTVLTILEEDLGTRRSALVWLNAPHPDLGGSAPLDVIRAGGSEVVRDLLEATRTGMPG